MLSNGPYSARTQTAVLFFFNMTAEFWTAGGSTKSLGWPIIFWGSIDFWWSIGCLGSIDLFDFVWIDWTGRLAEVPSNNQQNKTYFKLLAFKRRFHHEVSKGSDAKTKQRTLLVINLKKIWYALSNLQSPGEIISLADFR